MSEPIDIEAIYGTWRLVSEMRTMVATGEVIDVNGGRTPVGYITYGRDGRMMALLLRGERPRPESMAAITEAERAELHRTMLAYGGTFTFDGRRVTHHVDISWNEVWTGTSMVREVSREGARLVYRMGPSAHSSDGRMSTIAAVWEKVG